MRNDPPRIPGAEHQTDPQPRPGSIGIGLPSFRTRSGEGFDPDRTSIVDAQILQELRDQQRRNGSIASAGSEILRLAGIAAALHRGMTVGVGLGTGVALSKSDGIDPDDRSTLSEDAA